MTKQEMIERIEVLEEKVETIHETIETLRLLIEEEKKEILESEETKEDKPKKKSAPVKEGYLTVKTVSPELASERGDERLTKLSGKEVKIVRQLNKNEFLVESEGKNYIVDKFMTL